MQDVLALEELDRTTVAVAGGKAAALGELRRIGGVRVPAGCCVTTAAYRRVVGADPAVRAAVTALGAGDQGAAAAVRAAVMAVVAPDDLVDAVERELDRLGGDAFAVRSSATTEDAPDASAAGQLDSFLDVARADVAEHVRRCWASLFGDRAIAYRARDGDPAGAEMGVVVQRMLRPDAAGVLFTADPVGGDRRLVVVEAVAGLGDALVSGRVTPDRHRVRDGAVTTEPAGAQPVLGDDDVLALAALGRRLQAHFGAPQDVEWCLVDGEPHVVQSRPVTTLFPVPATDDDERHVYVSVGHQQMMTDAMKPLGLSVWQLTAPRPMHVAGSRLFVDVARDLADPGMRTAIVGALGASDPLIGEALQTLVDRDGFLPPAPDVPDRTAARLLAPAPDDLDPAVMADVVARDEAAVAAVTEELAGLSGTAALDHVAADLEDRKRLTFDPRSMQAVMAGIGAAEWLNAHVLEWLGEPQVADVLARSSPGNVTAEMGLALLDVADVVRPHPEVVAALERAADDDGWSPEALLGVPGGVEAHAALSAFLERHGRRCPGEIDITRSRWIERPAALVPSLLADVRHLEPGESARRVERGREQAQAKARDVLERLRALPDGEEKAAQAERMIDRLRTFGGFREHPKYALVGRYLAYKRALTTEALRLADAGVLADAEDAFWLSLPELRAVVATQAADAALIAARRAAFAVDERRTAPRVMTSDGEVVTATYRHADLPDGALPGLAVSAGTIEGRARVAHDLAHADLEPGDVLVTAFTDPSWTPALLTVAGLVTEAGGMTTHGAVIAREYGLPAVVGVLDATRRIEDGRRVRVHGTDGWVELL